MADRGRVLRGALPVVLASRAGVTLVAAAAAAGQGRSTGDLLTSWDGAWYLRLAEHGYPHALPTGYGNAAQTTLGFFPALPAAVRLAHEVTRLPYAAAGLCTTLVASLVAAYLLWTIVAERYGAARADRGVALVAVWPGAFVLAMVYPAALLVACVAGALHALERRHWLLAGAAAAVATACDPAGMAAVLPCAVAAWQALRRDRQWRALLAPAVACCGVGGFFLFLWAWTGTPLAWFVAQRHGWQGGAFGSGIPRAFGSVVEHGLGDPNSAVKVASTVLAAALLVGFLRRRPPATWVAYTLGVLALAAASPVVAWSPRAVLRAFPLLAVTGAGLPRHRVVPGLVVSALAMAALAVLSYAPSGVPFTP